MDQILNAVQSIKQALAEAPKLASAVRRYRKGETIIRGGDRNESIFVLLDGTVQLSKAADAQERIQVGMLGPGDLFGVISFYTEEPAFMSVEARSDVSALCLERSEFNRLSKSQPRFYALLQPLIINNLAERYRRIVQLHVEVALLTRELERERNQLHDTLVRLRQTQNRLIHQEKMATLGQLVAGLAHEINNPAASLLRSAGNLVEGLGTILRRAVPAEYGPVCFELFERVLTRSSIDTEDQRERMDELSRRYPACDRSLIRTLAQLGEEDLRKLEPALSGKTESVPELLEILQFFELGTYLRSMRISAERIGGLVKSLKSYGKESGTQFEEVDLREGVRDTLLMLGNRLRNVKVVLELPEIPLVPCLAGEINQVWTNIIMNACDAMENEGVLTIRCGSTPRQEVWVSIGDTGPGIRPEHMHKLFNPNFTTKTVGASYGLGLGLAISNDIVQKHGGRMEAANRPEGGAIFTVTLPTGAGA